MIEAYFHTQLMMQKAFKAFAMDGNEDGVIFVSNPKEQKDKMWHLRPGLKPDVVAGVDPRGGTPNGKPPLPNRSIGNNYFGDSRITWRDMDGC